MKKWFLVAIVLVVPGALVGAALFEGGRRLYRRARRSASNLTPGEEAHLDAQVEHLEDVLRRGAGC